MRSRTHDWVGTTSAIGFCAVADIPLVASAVIVASALATARGPDLLERPARRLHMRLHACETGEFYWRKTRCYPRRRLECSAWCRWRAFTMHRSWTHWLLTGLVVAAGLSLVVGAFVPQVAPMVFLGVLVGWTTHSLADGLTEHPVQLLGPFSMRWCHLSPRVLRFPGRLDGWVRVVAGGLALVVVWATQAPR